MIPIIRTHLISFCTLLAAGNAIAAVNLTTLVEKIRVGLLDKCRLSRSPRGEKKKRFFCNKPFKNERLAAITQSLREAEKPTTRTSNQSLFQHVGRIMS